MTHDKQNPADLEALLRQMPPVEDGGFSTALMRRITRRNRGKQWAYGIAWICALAGLFNVLPPDWLDARILHLDAPTGDGSLIQALQQSLPGSLAGGTPEQLVWLLLALGLALIALLVTVLLE